MHFLWGNEELRPTMVTPPADSEIPRYDQLKESVRALRLQVRGPPSRASPHPSAAHHNITTTCTQLVTRPSGFGGALSIPTDGYLEDVDQEGLSMQHLRLQFRIELQKKREEITKLVANQRGKAQQIENLGKQHKAQRRKLEARIEQQSEKIFALEAQLSNRIALHQQEQQAQAYACAAKMRQCEDEIHQQTVAARMEHVAALASAEEHHRAQLSQAQVIYARSLKRAEEAEAKVKALDAELVLLKRRMLDTQDLAMKKDEKCSMKMDRMKAVYEDLVQDLRARLKKERDDLQRVKEKHTLELQSYKMQKAREMDHVSKCVRAAVESKDTSIALLKEELAKQQEQASFLLDIS